MSFILNLLLFFVSLGVLVTIHELGHFSMAKLFGVYCQEFSIGFGPTLFKKKKGETQYSIRAIPLGGYVSMVGEGDPNETNEEIKNLPKERSLLGIAKWKRAIIMIAGVTLNFVLAFVLLVVTFSISPTYAGAPRVNVVEDSVVYRAGLRSEDQISKISITTEIGSKITKTDYDIKFGKDIWNALNENESKYVPTSKLDYRQIEFTIVEKDPVVCGVHAKIADEEAEEVTYTWHIIGVSAVTRARNVGEILSEAVGTTGDFSIALFKAIGDLFTNPDWFNQLGGPVQLFQTSSSFASQGVAPFLMLWALISINLGVFNLLPFPGLDGWHFLVLVIEGITRKEVPDKVKNVMANIGMILLFGLMIAVVFKDIFMLF